MRRKACHENVLAIERKSRKLSCQQLKKSYITKLLWADPTEEVIEAKRLQLKILRLAKEMMK
jgi:hypothetical protein